MLAHYENGMAMERMKNKNRREKVEENIKSFCFLFFLFVFLLCYILYCGVPPHVSGYFLSIFHTSMAHN